MLFLSKANPSNCPLILPLRPYPSILYWTTLTSTQTCMTCHHSIKKKSPLDLIPSSLPPKLLKICFHNVNKTKRQHTEWEKIFKSDMTDKELISKYINSSYIKKQISQFKNEQTI